MKRGIWLFLVLGANLLTTMHASAWPWDKNEPLKMVNGVPVPKLVQTIELTHMLSGAEVLHLAFSPDSHYLAADINSSDGTDIVIWDMEKNKKQVQFHCPGGPGMEPTLQLMWGRNGNNISWGAKFQWNPMTGKPLPDVPVEGLYPQLNMNRTKLVTQVGPTLLHIYDTSTWQYQALSTGSFDLGSVAWTADDKLVMVAIPLREIWGKDVEGFKIRNNSDIALRLIDPSEKTPTKTAWFPATPTGNPKKPLAFTFPYGTVGHSNFPVNKIFYDIGTVIDGETLAIDHFYTLDASEKAPGAFGMAFSPDGRLLYLKGALYKYGGHAPVRNNIVDAQAGKLLLEFDEPPDNGGGFSVSPDGKTLASGVGHTLKIYRLQ